MLHYNQEFLSLARKEEKKDYRTELEKKGIPNYFTMTDGAQECLRTLELMPNSIYVDLGSNKATHSEPLIEELEKFIIILDSGEFDK